MTSKLKKIVLICFIFISSNRAFSGEPDPTYIQRFKTRLNVRLLLNQNNFLYGIVPRSSLLYSKEELKNGQMNYGSYIPVSAGFAINFPLGGFGYDFRFTRKYFNATGKTVTDFRDIKMNIQGKRIAFEAFYERYFDNYLSNKKSIFQDLSVYDQDVHSRHWGLSMRINTNDSRFSYKAAFYQTEFQKKSAASILVWYGFDQNQIYRPAGLITESEARKYYDRMGNLDKLKQNLWFVQPGFAGNVVYKQFYFATAVYLGSGVQFNQQYRDSVVTKKVNLPFISRARSSIGINGDVFYTGLFANAEYARSSFETLKSEYFHYRMGFFLGLRMIKRNKEKEEKQERKEKDKNDKNRRA